MGGTCGTLMAWTPIYDEEGKNVGGGDPNTYTTEYHCHQCGARWTVSRMGDERTVSEPWWPKPVEVVEMNPDDLSCVASSEFCIGGEAGGGGE